MFGDQITDTKGHENERYNITRVTDFRVFGVFRGEEFFSIYIELHTPVSPNSVISVARKNIFFSCIL